MKFVLLDANLMVLLVVGAVDIEWLTRHKRVRAFDAHDWRLLRRLIDGPQLMTTPHILAETSNLLRSGGMLNEANQKLMIALSVIIATANEEYTPAQYIQGLQAYRRLGLTDAVILSLMRPGVQLLTADEELWREALALGQLASHFSVVRELERQKRS